MELSDEVSISLIIELFSKGRRPQAVDRSDKKWYFDRAVCQLMAQLSAH